MAIDPQAGAAIDQMVGLAVTSPIYTATPQYPIGRPASYHQSLIYYTRILAGYAHQTNDPELWNLVGNSFRPTTEPDLRAADLHDRFVHTGGDG